MIRGADTRVDWPPRADAEATDERGIRPGPRLVSDEEEAVEARTRLLAKLAADRLRELRDDGVTLGYIARMYDVAPDSLERLYGELVPRPPH
jgi:hypothetical protein